jgi:hypothetical protein
MVGSIIVDYERIIRLNFVAFAGIMVANANQNQESSITQKGTATHYGRVRISWVAPRYQ